MGFPNILDVGGRGKERGWMIIKLTLNGNHLQSAREGADVTTGPEKEEEELTNRKVKKGLKRGHSQSQSRANRKDLFCVSAPVQVSASASHQLLLPEPRGQGNPRRCCLQDQSWGTQSGGLGNRRSERQRITSTAEMPQPRGKCVLKHHVNCSLLLTLDLCLRCSWRKSSSLERTSWLE